MQAMTLEEFKNLAEKAERIAVYFEIPAGDLTPVATYKFLCNELNDRGAILEDLNTEGIERYSFLSFMPEAELVINDEKVDLFDELRKMQTQFAFSTSEEVGKLITGSLGFLTYDAIRYIEEIPDRHQADASLPTALFNFYSLSFAFDHAKKTILISKIVEVGECPFQSYSTAMEQIRELIQLLNRVPDISDEIPAEKKYSEIKIEPDDDKFMNMVNVAKQHIIQGDAFQIVLSRCFKRKFSASPIEIYKTLRKTSPSSFMFYFPAGENIIIGASPERLVRVNQNEITVNPIAGTRKRTGERSDEEIAVDLLTDIKELAEHRMLVDLARNDVGSVSSKGSVNVTELLKVRHYSHVSHITSTVIGKLRDDYDAFDALKACFPAGTLSGAPKIRAMEIIDALETSRRGLYGGVICRMDSLSNLESCIAIRMAVLKDGIATIRTGAGIVFDSNPIAETEETGHKANSMLNAIAKTEGEIIC